MHNIHELEKKWLSYKIKYFIPHLSFIVISIIALVVFLNIDFNTISTPKKDKVPIIKEKTPEIAQKRIKDEKDVVAKVDIVKVEVKEQDKVALLKSDDNTILTPSLDFIKKLRNNSNNKYQSNSYTKSKKQNIQKPKPKPIRKKITTTKNNIKSKTNNNSNPKKTILKIQMRETQADIEHVIKRFQKNNNPALSLFVAKKYYKLGKYDKSYNYALITNQLNNSIDDSWIIFSKSLVKLNQKNRAIEVLKRYINYSHSANAKVLLDDIISGKFK